MGLMSRLAQNSRQDGYTQQSIIAASEFQRTVETSSNPNYTALRTVLAESRTHTMDYSAMMSAYHKLAK